MKKATALLLTLLLLLTACGGNANDASEPADETSNVETTVSEEPKTPDPRAEAVWSSEYADEAHGLTAPESIFKASVYENGTATDENPAPASDNDVRMLFTGETATRAVVPAEGYCVTLPGAPEADFSLGSRRSQYRTDDYCLTLTYENQNPYSKDEAGYNMYITGWLTEHIDSTKFLADNQLMRTRPVQEVEVGPYTIKTYCMQINLASKIEMPFYQIAVIRPTANYNYFYLIVMKSKKRMNDTLDDVVASFREIPMLGTPTDGISSYECKENPNWSEETKAYYEYLQNRTDVGFGAFHERNSDEYTEWLWGAEALDATPDVYMTYLAMGWYGDPQSPEETFERADTYAGGDGFDGKPVFNLTYQFTETNNATGAYTPTFDILRGRLDDQFRELAGYMKDYGKPIIFRLNNEMNTDWTDYCGMMTLLDPDLFQMAWRHLYDLFEEEGVNNLIWVFNPIAITCPYCNWGETVCYMPGADYVQIFGLTNYEGNNVDVEYKTFRERYTLAANNALPYFADYPWMIGEFACGGGGVAYFDYGVNGYVTTEFGRNVDRQTQWVADMLDCFRNNQLPENEFCRRIKLAVWFSSNDYADVDGDGQYNEIVTSYMLDENAMGVIRELRKYLDETA